MHTTGWVALSVAAVCAVIDWIAVARHLVRLEYVFKPAVMVALIATALVSDPSRASVRGLLVFALVCGLAGDVALMLEHRPDQPDAASAPEPEQPGAVVIGALGASGRAITTETTVVAPAAAPAGGRNFMIGLFSFFLGHVGYVLAMYLLSFDWLGAGMGAVLALLVLLAFGFSVLRGADRMGGIKLAAPVALYMAVLGALMVFGIATASIYIAYGAIVFVASDLSLGASRFIRPHPLARITVAVTYHVAQGMLVVGLLH